MSDTTSDKPKIVVIGGGSGSFGLLQSLKRLTPHITALVSMADDGGSTGVLRDEYNVLPPGDIRQALVALSEAPEELKKAFNFRFGPGPFEGQSLGNLFLSALELNNSANANSGFKEAVRIASEVMQITGKVVPITLDNVRLTLTTKDGKVLHGENVVDSAQFQTGNQQPELVLGPRATINPAARAAILEADLIVIAPGDIYTSLGPALLVEGVTEACKASTAPMVYVCNAVQKPGHTTDFDVSDHVYELERLAGAPIIDTVLYNTAEMPADIAAHLQKTGEPLVAPDQERLTQAHYKAVGRSLLENKMVVQKSRHKLAVPHSSVKYDADTVAQSLWDIFSGEPTVTHDWLVAIDMDRTLIREHATIELLEKACVSLGYDMSDMSIAEKASLEAGESFQHLDYLKQRLTAHEIDQISKRYIELVHEVPLLYPDAMPLFDTLTKAGIPFVVLTYGEQDWQLLKLNAAGLHLHDYDIVSVKQKGILIKSWRQTDHYQIETKAGPLQAKHVLLVDDKAISFDRLPADCRGAWLCRPDEELLPSQQGNVPDNVQTIPDLSTILNLL